MNQNAAPGASPDGLPPTADVVIVGGGVIGLSTAFQLTRMGAGRVVVLERGHLGSGASGKSGALVRAHYTNIHEARLTQESLKIFKNWGDLVGHGDPGYVETGFVRVVAPEDETALWANVGAMREELGIDTWVVTPTELAEIEPLMRTDDLTVAAFEPEAGYCDPNATLYGFAAAARANGAEIHPFTRVTRVLVERGSVTGVETDRGTISANQVLIAAGATADRLLGPLGIDLGLTPWRSQVVVFRWPPEIDHTRKHRVVIDSTQHSWFRVEGAAGTLIGAEYGDRKADPDQFDETVDAGYVDHARIALANRFPAFAHATMRGAFSGVYMQSPDSHPIIDQIPAIPGLFVMAGDAGTSFKTSPAIGRCLAEWMTGGLSKLADLTPFRASRFAEGKPWVDELSYDARGTERTIAR
jgi:sarcosine oxidase, subunit beta